MVEKETAVPEERPIIASVIFNRIKLGMPLQIDPTVIYALKRRGEWKGVLTRKHLQLDDPYNTYYHKGLPHPHMQPKPSVLGGGFESRQNQLPLLCVHGQWQTCF